MGSRTSLFWDCTDPTWDVRHDPRLGYLRRKGSMVRGALECVAEQARAGPAALLREVAEVREQGRSVEEGVRFPRRNDAADYDGGAALCSSLRDGVALVTACFAVRRAAPLPRRRCEVDINVRARRAVRPSNLRQPRHAQIDPETAGYRSGRCSEGSRRGCFDDVDE